MHAVYLICLLLEGRFGCQQDAKKIGLGSHLEGPTFDGGILQQACRQPAGGRLGADISEQHLHNGSATSSHMMDMMPSTYTNHDIHHVWVPGGGIFDTLIPPQI